MDVLAPLFEIAGILAFVAAGVFTRIGAALFLLPGLGERAVPVRIRLGAALALALLLAPIIAPMVEHSPDTVAALGLAILAEAVAGLIIGLAGLYRTLPFGELVGGEAVAEWSIARVAEVFAFGLSLALPFIAVGFVYNLALGALSRAMPQLLVMLVGVPLLVWLGVVTLYIVVPEVLAR